MWEISEKVHCTHPHGSINETSTRVGGRQLYLHLAGTSDVNYCRRSMDSSGGSIIRVFSSPNIVTTFRGKAALKLPVVT